MKHSYRRVQIQAAVWAMGLLLTACSQKIEDSWRNEMGLGYLNTYAPNTSGEGLSLKDKGLEAVHNEAPNRQTISTAVNETPLPTQEAGSEAVSSNAMDYEKMACDFVRYSFSANGMLLAGDFWDEDAANGRRFYEWRRKLILRRRSELENDKTLDSLEIRNSHYSDKGNYSYAYLSTLETYTYTKAAADETQSEPAKSTHNYLIFMRRQSEGQPWKVFYAMDTGILSMQAMGAAEADEAAAARKFIRAASVYLPFLPDENNINMSPTDVNMGFYEGDILGGCEAFPYADLEALAAEEERQIQKDKLSLEMKAKVKRFETQDGLHALDREAAYDYAATWVFDRNPYYGNFTDLGGDCQNFASQILAAGGAPHEGSQGTGWYYNTDNDRAPAWTSVQFMYRYLLNNQGKGLYGEETESWQSLDLADELMIDWTMDGWFDHAMTVTKPGLQARVSAHFSDVWNVRVSDLSSRKVYIHVKGYK